MKRIWFLLIFCCLLSTSFVMGEDIVINGCDTKKEIELSGESNTVHYKGEHNKVLHLSVGWVF